jgi:hypothetical protein
MATRMSWYGIDGKTFATSKPVKSSIHSIERSLGTVGALSENVDATERRQKVDTTMGTTKRVLGVDVKKGSIVEIATKQDPSGFVQGRIVEMPEPGFPNFTVHSEYCNHDVSTAGILAVIRA